jgi:erythrocyte band 7 integral membrane protein
VTVFVNAIMYYKVNNPIHAVANVDDYGASARLLAATTLRNVLGTLNLGDILSQRETIARDMQVNSGNTKHLVDFKSNINHQETLEEGTKSWGVMVERVEVKDVRVPEQLMRAMAAEAEAARNARAKVIAAEGEHKASRSLRMAAEVIADSPAALQVLLPTFSMTSHLFPDEVPSNPEQHLSREQQHHHLPRPNRHHLPADEPGSQRPAAFTG